MTAMSTAFRGCRCTLLESLPRFKVGVETQLLLLLHGRGKLVASVAMSVCCSSARSSLAAPPWYSRRPTCQSLVRRNCDACIAEVIEHPVAKATWRGLFTQRCTCVNSSRCKGVPDTTKLLRYMHLRNRATNVFIFGTVVPNLHPGSGPYIQQPKKNAVQPTARSDREVQPRPTVAKRKCRAERGVGFSFHLGQQPQSLLRSDPPAAGNQGQVSPNRTE